MDNTKKPIEIESLALIPLRNMVVFPQMIVPLFIGREKSVKALEEIIAKEKMVIFAAQKNEEVEEPAPKDIYKLGTLCEIVQILTLPDGTTKLLVEGAVRVKIEEYLQEHPFFKVKFSRINEREEEGNDIEASIRNVIKKFETYVKLNKRIPSESLMSIINIENPGRLSDLIASYLTLKLNEKQAILETFSTRERLRKLTDFLDREVELLEVEKNLQVKVKSQIDKVQKEYYLKEKLKAIQQELGKSPESSSPEINEYHEKLTKAKLSPEAQEKAQREIERLSKMPSMGAESSVIRTYLDWIIRLPWEEKSDAKLEIAKVKDSLDKNHYGMKKIKERIVEFFAVMQLTGKIGGAILCLVGPPGVGKSSIVRSIAKATGRNFTRMALGGVRDEAEIRGHRKTYVGSLPGRIIQSIEKAKTNNPVFLLDEIDKLSSDFRGNPAAALLEVLDPEQNREFADHYLEIPFDLSDILFICTANTLETIPTPLRDRLEIIEMSSYTEEDKLEIARQFLIPKQIQKHGLTEKIVDINDEAVKKVVQNYTREAGVRNLEQSIASIIRKVATKHLIEPKEELILIRESEIPDYLGVEKFHFGTAEEKNQIGVATGLVWTIAGGDTIPVEVTVMPGKGDLTLTGKLGEVMQESGKAAISFVRSRANSFGLDQNFYRKIDVHIHFPEGATPKDGPSAGVTIATALVSALTKIPVKKSIAMTGEITLRGHALPVGGIKEKILGARRAGIETVIIPHENKKDLEEFLNEYPLKMEFIPAKNMDEILKIALTQKPIPRIELDPLESEGKDSHLGGQLLA